MRRDWTFIGAVAALALIAVIRVASTHRVFSATNDEPIHIAASYEWLMGDYMLDVTHPPLSRMLPALPLRVAGVPPPQPSSMIDRGNQILYHGGTYEKNLALARMGNLPLLVVAIVAVAALARRHFGRGIAIVATAIFTTVPAVLGHAGLVTTDLALTAAFPLALLALDLFLDSAATRRAIFLGFAIGVGVLSKLSFLAFYPPAALVMIAMRWRPRTRGRAIAVTAVIALLVFWAGYRFEIRKPTEVAPDAAEFFAAAAPAPLQGIARSLADVPMPAAAFPVGIAQVKMHDRVGHTAFLLGEISRTGWWYYFPVVFFYKTPLPLLILFAWGIVSIARDRSRRGAEHVLIAASIMLVAMTASLNIGLRHILPIYVPVSIVAAYGVHAIWTRARDLFSRAALVALLAWLFGGVAAAHPDYMAWFNELARPNPAAIAVDSNLDWGQDILRLADVVRERNIDRIYIAMNNSTRLAEHGIHADALPPHRKVSGWIATGENWLAFTDEFDWLRAYRPVARVGESIRLYHIP